MNEAEFYLEDLKSKFTKIDPSSYYLAYSGGRDSHFLLWFIREYLHETRIPAVFHNTGMEIPEIRKRAMENADVVLKPIMKHFEIKEKFGIPLNGKRQDHWVADYQRYKANGTSDENMPGWIKYYAMRQTEGIERGRRDGRLSFSVVNKKTSEAMIAGKLHKVSELCCMYMKKKPGKKYEQESGRKPIIGVMGSESWTRKTNVTSCFNKNRDFRPIYDLTEDLRNEIEKQFEIPVPYVYKYVRQTGCAGCPYGQHGKNKFESTNIDLQLCGESQRKFIMSYFKESYDFKGYVYTPRLFV